MTTLYVTLFVYTWWGGAPVEVTSFNTMDECQAAVHLADANRRSVGFICVPIVKSDKKDRLK